MLITKQDYQDTLKAWKPTNYVLFKQFYDDFITKEALPHDYKEVDRYLWTSLKVQDLNRKKKLQPSAVSKQVLSNAINKNCNPLKRNNMKTKFFTLCVALALAITAHAYDFMSGDLCYNITSGTTVEVTYKTRVSSTGNEAYTLLSIADIPTTVSYEGETYRVNSIGNDAFRNCSGLTSVTIPGSVTSIGNGAFSACSGLTSLTIPGSVTSINYGAFSGCSGLTSLTILEGVNSIGDYAFSGCSGLTSVTIPEGVTEISTAAFYGCTYLQDLTLPSSIQQLGDNCFALCGKLGCITIKATTPPAIAAKTFADVNRTIPLYVPVGTLDAYQSDIYWGEFLNITITEAPTAIKPVTIIEGVYAQNGAVVVENETNLPVAIYDVVGRLVVSGTSSAQHFAVPHAGLYMVKVGEQIMKLLVP